jgi:hypothetical protein
MGLVAHYWTFLRLGEKPVCWNAVPAWSTAKNCRNSVPAYKKCPVVWLGRKWVEIGGIMSGLCKTKNPEFPTQEEFGINQSQVNRCQVYINSGCISYK